MRRDSIFYKLFQQYPALLFELLTNRPVNAEAYRFDSVAVKEPKFEIDGVFLPPESEQPGTVYFCVRVACRRQVQFQKDEQLYERVVVESSLYFYRNRSRFSDWLAVIIYPSRNIEQSDIYPHRGFINSDQLHRVYLDELGDIRQLPIWVAVMVLTTLEESQAPEAARNLLTRTSEEVPEPSSRAIIEMITTIMAYKFEQLSRKEVEAMLGITLKQTRVYQDIKEEVTEEVKQEATLHTTLSIVIRLLNKRFGELSEEVKSSISGLPLPVLENLSEALLDFTSLADLQAWLADHRN